MSDLQKYADVIEQLQKFKASDCAIKAANLILEQAKKIEHLESELETQR